MGVILQSLSIFLCVGGASLLPLGLRDKIPARYRQKDTLQSARYVINTFAIITALVLGLMIDSTKNTFNTTTSNVYMLATDLYFLDRSLQHYGVEADQARQHLVSDLQQTLKRPKSIENSLILDTAVSEALLNSVDSSLNDIKATDAEHIAQLQETKAQYQKIVELQQELAEESAGVIPNPLIEMLAAWLILLFASIGYQAPRNLFVAGNLILASFLISGALYLIIDMNAPFSGLIQVSTAPLERVIAEI